MVEFSQVFNITGPVFLIIAIGYLSVRMGIVPRNASQALSAFVINFALPALLFKAISEKPVADMFDANYLIGYGVGSLLAFFILFSISKKLRQKTTSHSAIFAMGGSFSNNLMIGYPVVTQLFGNAAIMPLVLTLMIENFLMFPLVLILMDAHDNSGEHLLKKLVMSFKRVFSNPIILGILAGVLTSYLEITLPTVALKVIDLFAATVGGVALFAIGGLLVGIRVHAVVKDILWVTPTKLLIHPLMVLICFLILPQMDPTMVVAAVILASMPMLGIYPVLAEKHGLGPTCAAILLVTTVSSFVTLNAILWLSNTYLSVF